jgi:Skp family chaperone for outer membrane proteins
MSRNVLVVAVVALLLGAAALILQFVLPSNTGSEKSEIANLQTQVANLQSAQKSQGAPLKIAYINAEDAFSVFTNAVQSLRQKALDKQQEISKLQQDFLASKISKDDYTKQNDLLQVQLLQAQLNIDIGTIDKLISAPGFADMKSDLQKLKDEAQPVVDEMKNLVSTVQTGVVDPTDFQNRYTQVKNAFSQLDQLLTQAATSKIVQAAQKVAVDNGYDLVLRVKNVIVYRNTARMTDITDLVKHELASYL